MNGRNFSHIAYWGGEVTMPQKMHAIIRQLTHGTTIMTINNIKSTFFQLIDFVFYTDTIFDWLGHHDRFCADKIGWHHVFARGRSKGSGVTFLFIFFKSTHFYITL